MKMIFALLGISAAGAGAILLFYFLPHMETPFAQTSTKEITVGTTILRVEIADTEALHVRGLSGRTSIGEADGMLFVFARSSEWGIWMKDMQFSLDILWLAADGAVLTIASDIAPETYPQAFYPTAPARYVLEVPAGYAKAHAVVEGSRFVL